MLDSLPVLQWLALQPPVAALLFQENQLTFATWLWLVPARAENAALHTNLLPPPGAAQVC
jgi:hypothetical protein